MRRLVIGGLVALAIGLSVAPAAQACPCSEPPGVEGQTFTSADSGITYTCKSGQWYEGPYGPGSQS
jgi:hypothetical protein